MGNVDSWETVDWTDTSIFTVPERVVRAAIARGKL